MFFFSLFFGSSTAKWFVHCPFHNHNTLLRHTLRKHLRLTSNFLFKFHLNKSIRIVFVSLFLFSLFLRKFLASVARKGRIVHKMKYLHSLFFFRYNFNEGEPRSKVPTKLKTVSKLHNNNKNINFIIAANVLFAFIHCLHVARSLLPQFSTYSLLLSNQLLLPQQIDFNIINKHSIFLLFFFFFCFNFNLYWKWMKIVRQKKR